MTGSCSLLWIFFLREERGWDPLILGIFLRRPEERYYKSLKWCHFDQMTEESADKWGSGQTIEDCKNGIG